MKNLKHKDALEFIFAGKSGFKVINTKTKNEFTFSVKKSKDKDREFYFVKVLTGKTVDSYAYLGYVGKNGYSHGKKSTIKSDEQCVKVFEYILNKLSHNSLPDFIELQHDGRCGRCGRTLTVNDSIDMGIGPECIKKLSKQDKRESILKMLLS